MRRYTTRRYITRRRCLLAVVSALTLLAATGLPAADATTIVTTTTTNASRSADYLALGDSVPFGFNPLVPVGSDPHRYVGYPELAAPALGLRLTNLSCPGQTTGGFLSLTGTDNGCFAFRRAASLHAPYSGSQLDAAVAFLRAHPRTRLVTIMVGANDLFLCRKATADACTSPAEVGATLQTVSANLTKALAALRAVYQGQLVAVTYYTTDYGDASGVAALRALDDTVATTSKAYGATVADGFTPFQKASATFGGSACAAGLLIALPAGGCDVHPTRRGAAALALAVIRAVHGTHHPVR